mgnify:FL=1
MKKVLGGKNICGVSIGVLALESYFPKPPRAYQKSIKSAVHSLL